ncbi:GntR family transcriptional regulator [Sphaerimonospora cavernae]|uniref:GntR family transcriptional regulator n=1 Tax=Sphaerimonospora cavernae TaxID=1740611 RepID=A0ABV6U0I4_9ACTN
MLDRDGPVPIYRQIAEIIRAQIEHGDFVPGDPLPSEAELEAEYGIARLTARQVARELREQGLAHTIRGEGTFVGDGTVRRIRRKAALFEEIGKEIADRIRRGELKPGRPIPSEKTLMQQYGVAKATVRHAVVFLREHGWVFTVPYRGTYVSPPESWPSD